MSTVSSGPGSGTRISFDWSYRGFQACTMENEFLRITVIPQVGAKVHEMIFKPADRDLLYHHPRVELRQPVFGGNVDNWWTGGIDDALPTGAACELDGEELPFLGEAWSMPWTSERTSATSVCFSRDGVITPFRIERTMELRPGEPFVRQRHRITNVGTLPLRFIWGIHPGLPIGPATRIQIPARRGVVQDSWPDNRLGETGATYPWPKSELVELGPQAGGTWDLHYATELEAGWLAAWDAEWGAGFGMTFPADLFRCVWVWLVDGGWRGIRCAAVEPWLGYPGRLDEAIAADRAYRLEAGEVLTAETRLIGFETRSAIRGFDAEGRPVSDGAAM
jgi:galactose mutarotase-like enzyme